MSDVWNGTPPGSDAAFEQGCTCPAIDNRHGAGAWIRAVGDATEREDDMSDVRARLARELRLMNVNEYRANELADAILERFDVIPKPVVSESKLGFMVKQAYQDPAWNMDYVGSRMLDQLDAANLMIVRSDEVER